MTASYLLRYRGSLMGALGASAAVALTFDSQTGLASTSARFTLWFVIFATAIAAALTATVTYLEHRAETPVLPRAIVRR